MIRAADIERLRVDKLSIATSLLVRAATDLGLSHTLLPERTVLISHGSRQHFFRGTSLPCNDMVASAISRNKRLSRKLLEAAGVPAPKTMVLRYPASWSKVLNSRLTFPLVAKPITASHGRGSTMNIQQPRELKQAVDRAFSYIKKSGAGDRVLVEEFFEGHDLRLFVVGDRVVSVLRRVPAYVVGDGEHSIKELMQRFNQEWQSPIAFDFPLCPIPFDAELGRHLRWSKRKLRDVPAAGEKVTLRWNGNVSTGGRAFDVTDETHQSLKDVAALSAKTLHLPVAGVDMLVKDYHSADTTDANTVVLEVNDAPGIDIHELPFEGQGRPVTQEILKYIFELGRQGKD